jgi:hypothetical protein
LRSRQSIRVNPDPKELTPRQENALIKSSKDQIPELIGIPVTSFEASPMDMGNADLIKNSSSTKNIFVKNVVNQDNVLIKSVNNDAAELFNIPKGVLMDMQVSELDDPPLIKTKYGIFGVGLLAPRTNIPHEYITTTVSSRNIPIISKISTSNYFFITYDNPNNARVTLSGILKSFAVIKTLSQCTVKDCSEMLKLHYTNVIAISETDYTTGYFDHPKYYSDTGYPLQIRYAEIPIIKQKTPGRLDNIPLGYPDFDTTPDGVTTRKGPVPSPPYPDFIYKDQPPVYISQAGATSSGGLINVTSTTGLTAGMYVSIKSGATGSLAQDTKILSVNSNIQFTVSPSPLIPLIGSKNVVTAYLPLSIATGASAFFIDSSVKNPWQFAPTGWNWVFGPSASPTGSTGKNPIAVYNHPGSYTVVMTASNASGSTTKTKTNFVIVT